MTNKPTVKLSGQDGNVFNLLGLCVNALKKAGQADKAAQLTKDVFAADSYDAALALLLTACHVK